MQFSDSESEYHPSRARAHRLPQGWRLSLFLFLLTLVTTTMAGALQQGVNPLAHPDQALKGLPFSLTLMSILLIHETGHYLTSRHHRIPATLPYFIPAPTFLGTFGAFIKMRAPIASRQALIDIGASGPIAGFFPALAALAIGLALSDVKPAGQQTAGIALGSSLAMTILSKLILGATPDKLDIILHPIAFAGWIGLLVTSLNLLPIGQLDGGHVAYAVFGRHHRTIAGMTIVILIILGLTGWRGWLLWAALSMALGYRHPPVANPYDPLDSLRKRVGWAAILIFVLTFTPKPFMELGG